MPKKRPKTPATKKRAVTRAKRAPVGAGTPPSPDLPVVEEQTAREGYLIDFISGREVRDTPEERDAVQVLARILVNDYDYPKAHIQTRPQWRVKVRPSDRKKEYPVDIALFDGDEQPRLGAEDIWQQDVTTSLSGPPANTL